MSRLKMTNSKGKVVYNTHREVSVDESEKDTHGEVYDPMEKNIARFLLEEPFIDPRFRKLWEKKK